jgi:hypothetical protein
MAEPTTTVPKLDLAPKLNRPLQLWNPLDYLRLLYWALFFPQAIRWYVAKFKAIDSNAAKANDLIYILAALQKSENAKVIIIQSLLLTVTVPFLLGILAQQIGISWNWIGMLVGIIFFSIWGVAIGSREGIEGCIIGIIAGGMIAGGLVGLTIEPLITNNYFLTLILVLIFPFALPRVISECIRGGISRYLYFLESITLIFFSPMVIVILIRESTTNGLILFFSFLVMISRVFDFFFSFLLAFMMHRRIPIGDQWLSHISFLPLSIIQIQVQKWALLDLDTTIDNTNELLRYTLQFIPIVRAWNNVLSRAKTEQMLFTITQLVSKTYSWNLILFCSASLIELVGLGNFKGISFERGRFPRDLFSFNFAIKTRLDTFSHAACAGYWLAPSQWQFSKSNRSI